jgi:hypothetical protein
MGLTYTIFAGFLQIAAIIFGVLAYTADKRENEVKTTENTFNINGDFVNRDKKSSMNIGSVVKNEKTQVVKRTSIEKGDIIEKGKLQEVKQEKKRMTIRHQV